MKYFYSIVVLFLCNLSYAQTGPYWLLRGGGAVIDEGLDISIDAAGNTYTTGYFSGTATFGTSFSLASSGITDIFVAKVNAAGDYMWVVKAGGAGPDKGLGIKTDAQGNSYVTGFFQGTATFGSTTLTSVGSSQDIFLAKYNNAGVLQWAKSAGGAIGDIGNAVTTDNAGNVIITGQFSGAASFGSISLTSAIDPNTGTFSFDVFTAKYNATTGNAIWAKKGSAPYTDRGMDVACDGAGNVYVTGQFSDTITFDVTHYNNMYNAIFLIKYNASGAEQWFRYMGGSTQCISYGLATDNNSNIYVTGDFINQLIFFGQTNYTLTNTYPNCIFVSKYNAAGNLLWAKSDGSNTEITARNIAVDDSSNAYVAGSFKCRLDQYADVYGEGTFNSVGYWDVFASKYNAAGNRQWAKQSGGRHDDRAYGVAVNDDHDIIVCGGFYDRMCFPGSDNFNPLGSAYSAIYNYFPANFTYCGDSDYTLFYFILSAGNSDIFICKGFDPAKPPFDYYLRDASGLCQRPYVGVEIAGNGQTADTITACGSTGLSAMPNTGNTGPNYTWYWSNSSIGQQIAVSSTGMYIVTQTSEDGCFVSTDTVYVIIDPAPPTPTITDSKGVNINSVSPSPVYICLPDSVILTAGNICSGCTGAWSGPGTILNPTTIMPYQTGYFTFTVTNSYNCSTSNTVHVEIDTILTMPLIHSELIGADTAEICSGSPFIAIIVDTIFNNPYSYSLYHHSTQWSYDPPVSNNSNEHSTNCFPTQDGLYTIYEMHTIILENYCSSDTVYFYDTISIYAIIHPNPTMTLSVSGDMSLCPGDTTVITVTTNGDEIHWTGPGIIGPDDQTSIELNQVGTYNVTASLTDSNGCSVQMSSSFTILIKHSPQVTMNPQNGLMCPGGSVTLTCSGTGNYSWFGPSGPIVGNQQSIVVSTSGMYYCILTDVDGCELASNTVEVIQYNTPYIVASPSAVICPGQSVTLQAITNDGSSIQWLAPLSGNSLTQVITSAGTYTCNITSCGITTAVSIIVTQSNLTATITASGPLMLCPGDSVILSGSSGGSAYTWSNGSTASSIVVFQSGTYTVSISDNMGCSEASMPVTVSVYLIDPPSANDTTVCYGTLVTIHADAIGPIQWFVAPSGGSPLYTGNDYTAPTATNEMTYYLQTSDSVCNSYRTPVHIHIYPGSYPHTIIANSPLCEGETIIITIDSVTAGDYSWTGPAGFQSDSPNIQIPNAAVSNSGEYTLIVTSDSCADQTISVNVQVDTYPHAQFDYSFEAVCEGILGNFTNTSQGSTNFEWYFSNGFTSNSSPLSYIFNYDDDVQVSLIAFNNACTDTMILTEIPFNLSAVVSLPPPNVFTVNSDGFNDCFHLETTPAIEDCYKMVIFDRWGKKMYVKDDGHLCWDGRNQYTGKDVPTGVYFYIITIGERSYNGSVTLFR